MPYGKVDELAINTIRTLAVRQRSPLLPRPSITNSYPAVADFSPNAAASVLNG
jgi:hypothetical protein